MTYERQTILCKIINQLHSIETKVMQTDENQSLNRKFDRTKSYFKELGLYIHDPIGEDYHITRTDCEASISGNITTNLKVVEVVKPIIYSRSNDSSIILQRGVVLVEGNE